MAEMAPSQMTGGASDWLAWLTDPHAPMPKMPDVGAAVRATGDAVAPYVDYATRPNAPVPPLPSLPSNAAPGTVRPPPQPPAYMTSPTPAVAQSGPPPRIPTPGASPEAQNTSNWLDALTGMFTGGPRPTASQAIIADAAAGAPPPARPQMTRPMLGGQQTAMGGSPQPQPVPSPTPATPAVPSPGQPQQGAPPAPSPSPSVPEDNSDNIAMGTGPGHAVSHDQAAAISGAAANLGTKVAQDPNTVSGILNDLRTKGMADNDENAWLALANAGFATMASRSPFVGQAIGEGAQAGLESYNQSRAARAQQLSNVVGSTQRQQGLEQQGTQIAQTGKIAQETLDQRDQEFQQDLDLKKQTMPADLALKAAQADYYKQHGDYYQGRIGTGGGTGGGKSPNYIQDTYNKTYQADIDAGMDQAAASAHANQVARGTQNQQHNALVNQYLKAQGYSLGMPGTPQDVLDAAQQYADAGGVGGGAPASAPVKVASAAPAPSAPAAAPVANTSVAPVGRVSPGTKDGQTSQQGKLVAKDGLWYPAQ